MNVLVVGGAGYIGSHTVKVLLDEGNKVVVVDDLSTGKEEQVDERAVFIYGNCSDYDLMTRIINEYNVQSVMHFAGKIVVSESMENPQKYYYHNIVELLGLLTVCRDNDIKHFVFSSTASVYGNGGLESYDEHAKVCPMNPYAQTKLDGEHMIQFFAKAYGMKYVIFRYFNVAGAELDGSNGSTVAKPTHIIPAVIDTVRGIRAVLEIYGTDYQTADGTCVRDYIHVVDLARAHWLGLNQLAETGQNQLYNLGSGAGYSVKEVIDTVNETLGVEVPVKYAERRAGDPDKIIADATKANNELKWYPSLGLKEMIQSHYLWKTRKTEE